MIKERFNCSEADAVAILDDILNDLTEGDNISLAEAENALICAVNICQGGHTTITTRFRFMCGCHGKIQAEKMVHEALVQLAKGESILQKVKEKI